MELKEKKTRITLNEDELEELITALRRHTLEVQSIAIHSKMFEGSPSGFATARAQTCFNLLQRLEKAQKNA